MAVSVGVVNRGRRGKDGDSWVWYLNFRGLFCQPRLYLNFVSVFFDRNRGPADYRALVETAPSMVDLLLCSDEHTITCTSARRNVMKLALYCLSATLAIGFIVQNEANGGSLIVNGGAESGLLSWTTSTYAIGSSQSCPQGESYPTVLPFSGDSFFSFCERYATSASMYQEGTTGLSAPQLHLSLMMQTVTRPGLPTDFGQANLKFFDSSGDDLQVFSTGSIDNSPANGEWRLYQLTADVPTAAVKWRVELLGTLDDGSFINVFYDDVVLTSTVPEPIPGDLNVDPTWTVDSKDLDIVRAHWNETVPTGDLASGDATGDGYVGSGDLDLVRANWGAGMSAAVPEPEIALFGLSGIFVALMRRRPDSGRGQ